MCSYKKSKMHILIKFKMCNRYQINFKAIRFSSGFFRIKVLNVDAPKETEIELIKYLNSLSPCLENI